MKAYKIIIVLLLASLIFFLTSCKKSEEIVTKEITQEAFNKINLKSFGNISVVYGQEQKIVFKGSETVYSELDIQVIHQELIIASKKSLSSKNLQADFIITIPKIIKLNVDGNGAITLNDFEQTENLSIEIVGTADIKIHNFSKVKNLKIDVPGSAEIEMLSNFDDLNVLSIASSGTIDYKGYLLKTQDCNIELEGSGDIKVWVEKNLNINISGSATVFYKGQPSISKRVDGSVTIMDQN